MNAFSTEGLTFEVDDFGPADGDAIILLHGFPESKQSWRDVAPLLVDAGYRVLAPNQRGYSRGARPRSRRAYTIDNLRDDVLALADAAELETFHVVGHDWGGMVAWALAAAPSGRVMSAASLTTPHPRAMARAMLRGGQLAKSAYAVAFQIPAAPELALRSSAFWATLVRSGMPADFAAEYRAMFSEASAARGALHWYRGVPFAPLTRIGAAQVPVLYVYGTGDFALGRRAADATADYVSAAYRYEVLDGVSHWMPEEVPEVVAQLVVDFAGSQRAGR